jgi:hypothetical protein
MNLNYVILLTYFVYSSCFRDVEIFDDPNVARFKFNRNRPQRLSFIANVDSEPEKQEEWCIREWLGSQIQVVPDCDGNNPFSTLKMFEVYFLEVV